METETSAGHHHHSGNNTRDGYHKGKLWAPGCLGKMIWLARNNELWESACPALIFLPWHPLQGCQSDGRIKRPKTFSFSLPRSLPVSFFSRCQEGSHWSAGMSWKLNYLLTGPLKQPSKTYCLREKERERHRLLFIHICHLSIESSHSSNPRSLAVIFSALQQEVILIQCYSQVLNCWTFRVQAQYYASFLTFWSYALQISLKECYGVNGVSRHPSQLYGSFRFLEWLICLIIFVMLLLLLL